MAQRSLCFNECNSSLLDFSQCLNTAFKKWTEREKHTEGIKALITGLRERFQMLY